MSTAIRWLLVLLLLPAAILPGAVSGLVLCLDSGPDSHFAIEWASCCADPAAAPAAPASMSAGECTACTDLPLESMTHRATVRPLSAVAAAALPPPAPSALLPDRAGGVPLLDARPAPRPAGAAPRVLRI